jgi:hypothetical protein
MTGEPNIDYDTLALEAMRGLVRTVLVRTAKSGLPGDHHFYISFDTEHPGTSLSRRLKERYPREMTIVLQHRFWDLAVTEDRFEVKLTFDSIPERLVVPFAAIKVFFDPSVQYGLRFEDGDSGDASEPVQQPPGGIGARSVTARSSATAKKPRTAKRPKGELMTVAPSAGSSQPVPMGRGAPTLVNAPSQPQPVSAATDSPVNASPPGSPPAAASGEQDRSPAGGAQILSLDQFRKK